MDRRLDVDMADGAAFLGVEALVFGRAAMGEQVGSGRIAETITVRRGGRLVLHDAVRLSGDIAAQLARPAIAGGARAVATIVFVAPDADAAWSGCGPPSGRRPSKPAPPPGTACCWPGCSPRRRRPARRDHGGLGLVARASALPRVWMC